MNQALHAVCLSKGLVRQIVQRKHWRQLLGVDQISGLSALGYRFHSISGASFADNTLLLDWGNKRKSFADKTAQSHGLPVLRLEDGFIRSISAGSAQHQSFAIVLDDMGIYYDANQASRLESWLNEGVCRPIAKHIANDPIDLNDPALLARARYCIEQITHHHLSKYNDLDDISFEQPHPQSCKRILLVDQLRDDLSIAGAAATADTFEQMLESALQNHPDAEIIIKLHPAAGVKGRRGHFSEQSCRQTLAAFKKAGVGLTTKLRFINGSYNAIALLKQVDQVYVVSSQLGFEALMLNKPVHCFGLPFYAGWGLTDDSLAIERRTAQRSVEQIFAAAYLLYSYYFDPVSDQPCELEQLLDFMQRQREMFKRNRGVNYCLGFPPWKRAYLRRFLFSPWGRVEFCRSVSDLQKRLASDAVSQQRVIVWGHINQYPGLLSSLGNGLRPVQVEDGFIRSVGLGKYYIPPASLVFDQRGIYYDPNQASELEVILATQQFSAQQLSNAERLIEQLSREQITKYNVGASELPADLMAQVSHKTILLVVGQVENDASIQLACQDINSDITLLNAVYQLNKARRAEIIIVYKPHPDVVSGNSINQVLDASATELALFDYRITEVDMPSCLEIADEVHTMTSLAGFEALIRGLNVFTYGAPFYAGWGLTVDAEGSKPQLAGRRGRQLTLGELVAATLILYPRYIHYDQGYFISAEQALAKITHDKQGLAKLAAGSVIKVSKAQRLYLKSKNLLVSLWYGFRVK